MNASASLIFVRFMAGVSKAGNDYQMLELSDGLVSKTFFVTLEGDDLKVAKELERGERFVVGYSSNMFDERNPFNLHTVSRE